MAKIQAIKGFADLFADESRLFAFLEQSARTVFFVMVLRSCVLL